MKIHTRRSASLFVLPMLALFFFSAAPACHAQTYETVSISTYYPAPYGVYFELRTARMAIGSYYKNTGAGCYAWGGGGGCTAISNNANLVVDGHSGFGTTLPDSSARLTIDGSVASNIAAVFWKPSDVTINTPVGFLGFGTNLVLIGVRGTSPASLVFNTGGANRMIITNTGNTGIISANGSGFIPASNPPNGVTSGNLDVNDVWLRGATPPKWASQASGSITYVRTAASQNDKTVFCPATHPTLTGCFTGDDQGSLFNLNPGDRTDLGSNDLYIERVQSGARMGCMAYDKEHLHRPYWIEAACTNLPSV